MKDKAKEELTAELTAAKQRIAFLEKADRRRNDTEAGESKLLEKIKAVFGNLPVGLVFLDNNFRISNSNKFFNEFVGLREDELIGKCCYEIVGEYSDDPTKKGLEKICSFCKKDECFKTKTPTVIERPLKDKYIRVTTIPEFNESGEICRFMELIEDITARKHAEAEVESLSRFPKENPNPVLRINSDKKVLYKNESFNLLLKDNGLSEKDLFTILPANIGDLIDIALREEQAFYMLEVQSGNKVISYNLIPVKEKKYINLYGREITESKKAEAALKKAKDELELRVDERTKELSAAVQKLQSEAASRKQIEQQIRESLEEKELLLKEIHHRVKNNMAVISSLLKLQSNHVKNKQFRAVLNDSMSRIKSMALIHEKLYRSDDLARIDFCEYIKDMVDSMYVSYGLSSNRIKLKKDVERINIGIDAAIPCGLIVNELLSNAMKHAFPDDSAGEITLSMHTINEDEVALKIMDNGIGIPEDVDFRNTGTLGMSLINTLVRQLKGTIELNRGMGSAFTVTFRIRH